MDLLHFDPYYKVVVCRLCQCAVVPNEVCAHLKALYKANDGLMKLQICECALSFLEKPAAPPATTQQLQPLPTAPPIPFLALHRNGFRCQLCPPTKLYICCSKGHLVRHVRQAHQRARL